MRLEFLCWFVIPTIRSMQLTFLLMSRCYLSLPRSRCLTFAKTMSSTAFIIHFDHQSSVQITGNDWRCRPLRARSCHRLGPQEFSTIHLHPKWPLFRPLERGLHQKEWSHAGTRQEIRRKCSQETQSLRWSKRRLGRCVCKPPRRRCVF